MWLWELWVVTAQQGNILHKILEVNEEFKKKNIQEYYRLLLMIGMFLFIVVYIYLLYVFYRIWMVFRSLIMCVTVFVYFKITMYIAERFIDWIEFLNRNDQITLECSRRILFFIYLFFLLKRRYFRGDTIRVIWKMNLEDAF